MKIMIYSIDQTGPNSHAGGAQEGFLSCAYQLLESILHLPHNKAIDVFIISQKIPTQVNLDG